MKINYEKLCPTPTDCIFTSLHGCLTVQLPAPEELARPFMETNEVR